MSRRYFKKEAWAAIFESKTMKERKVKENADSGGQIQDQAKKGYVLVYNDNISKQYISVSNCGNGLSLEGGAWNG